MLPRLPVHALRSCIHIGMLLSCIGSSSMGRALHLALPVTPRLPAPARCTRACAPCADMCAAVVALEWPGSVSQPALAAAHGLMAVRGSASRYNWQLLRMHYKMYARRRRSILAK